MGKGRGTRFVSGFYGVGFVFVVGQLLDECQDYGDVWRSVSEYGLWRWMGRGGETFAEGVADSGTILRCHF